MLPFTLCCLLNTFESTISLSLCWLKFFFPLATLIVSLGFHNHGGDVGVSLPLKVSLSLHSKTIKKEEVRLRWEGKKDNQLEKGIKDLLFQSVTLLNGEMTD